MVRLYEYAVIYAPRPMEDKLAAKLEAREKSKVLVAPTTVLADDEKEVTLRAAKQIPAEYDDKLADVQIAVRPF